MAVVRTLEEDMFFRERSVLVATRVSWLKELNELDILGFDVYI